LFCASAQKSLNVCLLDDDASVLRATGRLLRSVGWEVTTFSDPLMFLEHARACQCKVAVIDILMPVMHGLEVQRQLRDISPRTRVVVLTSKDDPAVRSKALNAGASSFFVKPAADEEFLAGVESAFAEHH
jgi:two-component system, LuxR family, response regulator FixJ